MATKTIAQLKTGRDFVDVLDSALNLTDGGAVTGAISTGGTLTTDLRPVFGSNFGMAFVAPTVGSSACTLVVDKVNAPTYTGGAALAAALPAAVAGAVLQFLFAEDPQGGTAALTINCAGDDAFETGSNVYTTTSNKILLDTSTAGETALAFTPANANTNIYDYGAIFEFVCVTTGLWHVNSVMSPGIGVTNGAAAGTLLFAA
tara:strand:- start:205 stop:813 length:609 start_codon:yes stop_codon:yes gene_type:complete